MKKNVVIAMCGKTHSGKTTFGKKIFYLLPKSVLIDHDVVAEFLNKHFKNIHKDPEILATRTPTNPDMRLLIPQLIYDYSLNNGYDVILTASHTRKEIRRQQREIAKKHNAIFILIFFNLPNSLLEARVRKSRRSISVLVTPNFDAELEKQYGYFENPTKDEADYFFEIQRPEDQDNIEQQISSLLATVRTATV